jgi:hypothetical protein
MLVFHAAIALLRAHRLTDVMSKCILMNQTACRWYLTMRQILDLRCQSKRYQDEAVDSLTQNLQVELVLMLKSPRIGMSLCTAPFDQAFAVCRVVCLDGCRSSYGSILLNEARKGIELVRLTTTIYAHKAHYWTYDSATRLPQLLAFPSFPVVCCRWILEHELPCSDGPYPQVLETF